MGSTVSFVSVSVPESKVPSGCDSAPIAKENNITPLLNNDQQSKNSSTELPATLPEEALTSGPTQAASPESPCVEKQLHSSPGSEETVPDKTPSRRYPIRNRQKPVRYPEQ